MRDYDDLPYGYETFNRNLAIDFMTAKQLAAFLQLTSDEQENVLALIEERFDVNRHDYEKALASVIF